MRMSLRCTRRRPRRPKDRGPPHGSGIEGLETLEADLEDNSGEWGLAFDPTTGFQISFVRSLPGSHGLDGNKCLIGLNGDFITGMTYRDRNYRLGG